MDSETYAVWIRILKQARIELICTFLKEKQAALPDYICQSFINFACQTHSELEIQYLKLNGSKLLTRYTLSCSGKVFKLDWHFIKCTYAFVNYKQL